ncbi:hypothetical protein Tco_1248643 [Tanacetum coccineum]
MASSAEALIIKYAVAPTPPSPPLPPLTLLSSPLPHIPSPPLPVPSPPLPLPSPTISHTYDQAPLGYKPAMIWSRAASPPLLQDGHVLTSSVDYGFIDTVDASVRASKTQALLRGDTFARWLLLMNVRLLMPVGHGLTLRAGARPWRPRLELCRGMLMYYRHKELEMRTN